MHLEILWSMAHKSDSHLDESIRSKLPAMAETQAFHPLFDSGDQTETERTEAFLHQTDDDLLDARDEQLAKCISDLMDRLQQGQALSLSEACLQYPLFANDLRDLWGTILVTDAIGAASSSTSNRADHGSAADIALPCTIGDYELIEEVGRGGMGVVYRAMQQSLGREVAIKMIQTNRSGSSDEMTRFFVEAESTARLNHPNIVPVFEVGQLQGRPFFSMEFIRGQTLLARISQSPIPQRAAVQIVAPICRAVALAHREGIVHRDIKPSNILIDVNGTPKLTDFGLAKLIDSEQAGITKTGAILGTPTYMSPEQATGQERQIGPASDIYSIGSVLYHALTGRPPLVANSPIELAMKIIEQDPPAPRLLEPRLDRDLEMIVIRCLQKPPDLRYKTADDLAKDLEAFLRDEPISASSGQFSQVLARIFRETHHAPVLENWGLLWMWHSVALVIACLMTEWLQFEGVTNRSAYAALWTLGLGAWAAVFWALRRRMGPVTFVERQVAHVWGASMLAIAALFPLEWWLGLATLALSPLLGVITSMVFAIKAGMLSGAFYIQAVCLMLSSILMAMFPAYGHAIFAVVSGLSFFIPGLKYYRQRKQSDLIV
jgi:hypothetical protein